MRTLREIGDFVGIPEDSPEYGSPSLIGLRLIGDLLAPISPPGQNRSLRGCDALLDTLTPISLDAMLLNSGGVEPFEPVIRLVHGSGLVISTHILFYLSGQLTFVSKNYGAAGGDMTPVELSPGQWDILVRRAGIGNTGYVRLDKWFRAYVSRKPSPPPPPAPLVRPHIDVHASGPLTAIKYTVTGTGFLPNQPANSQGITVRVVEGADPQDWVMLYTGSDASGKINLTTGALDTTRLTRNALGQASVNFSATDKRKDPSSVPANEPLWSNTVPFTY